jgi:hypothetical protein
MKTNKKSADFNTNIVYNIKYRKRIAIVLGEYILKDWRGDFN